MKPRNILAQTETVTQVPLDLIEHDGRFYLETSGTQTDGYHLKHPARELVNTLTRPFRPARKPRVIFLGLGFGHAPATARECLPQENASFVIFPEAHNLADLLSEYLPENPLDDERFFIEEHSPYQPIPSDFSGSQAIVADIDHLQTTAPQSWAISDLAILHNFFDSIKTGGLVGLIASRPDSLTRKEPQKMRF